jgi:hypothetical protein
MVHNGQWCCAAVFAVRAHAAMMTQYTILAGFRIERLPFLQTAAPDPGAA